MPKGFTKCEQSGGKVRTITKGGNKGKLICFDKKGNKAHMGYQRGHKT